MKKILNSGLVVMLMTFFVVSCSTQYKTLENGMKIDNRLVGVWSGSEKISRLTELRKNGT